MIQTVQIPVSALPPCRRDEILRYAGAREESTPLSCLLDEAISETESVIHCRLCWLETDLPLHIPVGLGEDLCRHLSGCSKAVLFAATLGIGLDRLIVRYGKTSPAKALLLQAVGTERIEALCDLFCADTAARYSPRQTTGRFSPGYGDLPLEFQKEIFRILDCPKAIGLTLNDSMIMSPVKSVTAVIGIGDSCRHHMSTGCSNCKKTDCIYRRSL